FLHKLCTRTSRNPVILPIRAQLTTPLAPQGKHPSATFHRTSAVFRGLGEITGIHCPSGSYTKRLDMFSVCSVCTSAGKARNTCIWLYFVLVRTKKLAERKLA